MANTTNELIPLFNELDEVTLVARDLAKSGRALEATAMLGEVGARIATAMNANATSLHLASWDISLSLDLLVDSKLAKLEAEQKARERDERIAFNIAQGMSQWRAEAIG